MPLRWGYTEHHHQSIVSVIDILECMQPVQWTRKTAQKIWNRYCWFCATHPDAELQRLTYFVTALCDHRWTPVVYEEHAAQAALAFSRSRDYTRKDRLYDDPDQFVRQFLHVLKTHPRSPPCMSKLSHPRPSQPFKNAKRASVQADLDTPFLIIPATGERFQWIVTDDPTDIPWSIQKARLIEDAQSRDSSNSDTCIHQPLVKRIKTTH